MNKTQKFQTPSGRRAALWGLVAVLALLLALSFAEGLALGAGGQGSAASLAGAQAQSPVSNIQSPISSSQSPTSSRTIMYAYDAAGRLVSAGYGGGEGITYGYDITGNLGGVAPGAWPSLYLPLMLR